MAYVNKNWGQINGGDDAADNDDDKDEIFVVDSRWTSHTS